MTSSSPAEPTPAPGAYGFGGNWRRFVREHLDPERERIALESVKTLLDRDSLRGRSFLDIGSGSGLFSLAALRLGADRVTSFDVDPDSVASTRALRDREGAPEHWEVLHGSILDDEFVAALQPADIVYSWGVLHHTGEMHHAIRNAAGRIALGGSFALAIYNRVTVGAITSERWLRIKQTYNRAPRLGQVAMESLYLAYWAQGMARQGIHPLREAKRYRQERGMAIRTDVSDWLGGYPYEFATVDEIRALCEGELGLKSSKVIEMPPRGSGNNEFVFIRP